MYSDVGVAFGATAMAGLLVAETFITGGVGVWNDGIAIGAASGAWINAQQSVVMLCERFSTGVSDMFCEMVKKIA